MKFYMLSTDIYRPSPEWFLFVSKTEGIHERTEGNLLTMRMLSRVRVAGWTTKIKNSCTVECVWAWQSAFLLEGTVEKWQNMFIFCC